MSGFSHSACLVNESAGSSALYSKSASLCRNNLLYREHDMSYALGLKGKGLGFKAWGLRFRV